jgi:hypothetical protein
MSGHNVFKQLMYNIREVNTSPINSRITQKQFDQWQKLVCFDIIKGLRYGQSFCNHFEISDNILYYEFSWINAEAYIKRVYIEKS